jgi:hypothetical protein
MKSIKLNAMFWLAGLVAGVVLMERWRRHGGRYVPVQDVGDGFDAPATPGSAVSKSKPKTSARILSGAKADAERARDSVTTLISRVGSGGPGRVPSTANGDT